MTRPRKNPGVSGVRTRDLPLPRRKPFTMRPTRLRTKERCSGILTLNWNTIFSDHCHYLSGQEFLTKVKAVLVINLEVISVWVVQFNPICFDPSSNEKNPDISIRAAENTPSCADADGVFSTCRQERHSLDWANIQAWERERGEGGRER